MSQKFLSLESALASQKVIRGQAFKGDDMTDFHVVEARFADCLFNDCNFEDAIFVGCEFLNCRFAHSSFRNARFEKCTFLDAENHSGTEWSYCNLSDARFKTSNLGMNAFVKCDAFLLSMVDCSATGLKFEAEVHRRISKKQIFGGVDFSRCKLHYAVFSPGNYEESKFEGCDLREVSFAGSNLTRATFSGSSLNGTDFTGATLDHAILAHATYDQLDLSVMQSHHEMVISRDQHEALLKGMGLRTLD